jgi:hypothetical protein
MHHGFMENYDDTELGMRLLPGVDLTLWLRLVMMLLLALVVGGIALAAY